MYGGTFGCQLKPFKNGADNTTLYLTERHSRIFQALLADIRLWTGVHVLTGAAGTGKTLFARKLRAAATGFRFVELPPSPSGNTLHHLIDRLYHALQLPVETTPNGGRPTLAALGEHLSGSGEKLVVVFDDAHELHPVTLRELFAQAFEHLGQLQLLFIGLPALESRLDDAGDEVLELSSTRYRLLSLSDAEIGDFIETQMIAAGSSTDAAFTEQAIAQVVLHAHGKTGAVAAICDSALALCWAGAAEKVDACVVCEAAQLLGYQPKPPPATRAAESGGKTGTDDNAAADSPAADGAGDSDDEARRDADATPGGAAHRVIRLETIAPELLVVERSPPPPPWWRLPRTAAAGSVLLALTVVAALPWLRFWQATDSAPTAQRSAGAGGAGNAALRTSDERHDAAGRDLGEFADSADPARRDGANDAINDKLATPGGAAALTVATATADAAKANAPAFVEPTTQGRIKPESGAAGGLAREADFIRLVQSRLAALNLNPGPIDGLLGQRTRQAIEAFRHAAGLPAGGTAAPDLTLLQQLQNAVDDTLYLSFGTEPTLLGGAFSNRSRAALSADDLNHLQAAYSFALANLEPGDSASWTSASTPSVGGEIRVGDYRTTADGSTCRLYHQSLSVAGRTEHDGRQWRACLNAATDTWELRSDPRDAQALSSERRQPAPPAQSG